MISRKAEFSKRGVTWFPRTSVVPIKFIINHKSDVKREEKKKKASEREQVKEKERERGGAVRYLEKCCVNREFY